jgi:hypothetical protein
MNIIELGAALELAISDRELADVEALLAQGADPNWLDDCDEPMIARAWYEPEKLNALLVAGARADVRWDGYAGNEYVVDLSMVEHIICSYNEERPAHQERDGQRYETSLALLLEHGAPCQVRAGIEVPSRFDRMLKAAAAEGERVAYECATSQATGSMRRQGRL